MSEANPQPSPEKFSDRLEIKPLIDDLKMEVDQRKEVIDAIDQRFDSKKMVVLKNAQDARLELATRVTLGMETPELVVELSRVIQEELIEAEMKAGDLKTLTITDLLDLEAEKPGILLFAFTTWGDAHKNVSIEQFGPYLNPSPGTEMVVDFRRNRDAYWKVGAGNLLPSRVEVIKVTDATGQTRIGKRMTSPRDGFYDENGYLPIYDGYKITIATPSDYVGAEPVTESPRERELKEYRVDLGDPTGRHRARATRSARRWRGEHGERVRPRDPDLRRAVPDSWLTAGQDASDYYREAMGVSVAPAVTFAIINRESGFNAGTPNKQGLSSALGLGQFVKGTWEGFMNANKTIVETVTGTNPDNMSGAEKLNLRTHPILSIYAVTWLTADNAKKLHIKEVTPDNAAEIYFYHHEGIDGGARYLTYERLRSTHGESEAANMAGLHSWQRSRAVIGPDRKPLRQGKRIVYEPGSRHADENLRHVRSFAKDVERISRRYEGQLAQRQPSEPQALQPAPTPQPSSEQLDLLAKNPTLSGRTLLVGSSSTIGYGPKMKGDITTEAAEGRSIVTMNERLRAMPVDQLSSFDRIVIQGGIKNTDKDAPTIDRSVQAMEDMVSYLREKAPDVKIYITEVTPWNEQYDPKIRAFNDHINTPEFRSKVTGIIPTYSIMDNGAGRQRAAFGKPGELHVARYDRYAGVLADWITRQETSPETPTA